MNPPRRLMDDPGLEPLLRQDLRVAAAEPPVPFDVTAAASRFEAQVASGAALAAKLWVVGGIGGAGAGAAALWLALSGAPEPASPEPAVVPAPAVAVEPAPEPELAPEPEPAPEAAAILPAPVAPADPPRKETRRAPVEPPSLEEEMRLTARARTALPTDPGLALSLVREARGTFGRRGLFREERQAIEIQALHALGREPAARKKAERFLARHGDGPFAARIRALLPPE